MILSAFVLLYISYTLRKTARGQLDIYDLFMLSAVAILPALFIFWPAFANKAASLAGVAFPFVVMFSALLAILFIFIHRLVSIVHRLNADNRLLIQELALLREKVERMACQREQT